VRPAMIGTFAAALCAASFTLGPVASAEYPERPIRIICAHAAGGGGDLMVRWYANALKDLAGKPVTVENRVGANGHLGNQAAWTRDPTAIR